MVHCTLFLFFFNDTATTEIYTLSLHDALPICAAWMRAHAEQVARLVERMPVVTAATALDGAAPRGRDRGYGMAARWLERSEEHTSELQSRQYLVCRLLLEKKKTELVSNKRLVF